MSWHENEVEVLHGMVRQHFDPSLCPAQFLHRCSTFLLGCFVNLSSNQTHKIIHTSCVVNSNLNSLRVGPHTSIHTFVQTHTTAAHITHSQTQALPEPHIHFSSRWDMTVTQRPSPTYAHANQSASQLTSPCEAIGTCRSHLRPDSERYRWRRVVQHDGAGCTIGWERSESYRDSGCGWGAISTGLFSGVR